MVTIAPASTVSPAALADCLHATARRDPLVIPVDPAEVLAQEAFVATVDDQVVGVAWWRSVGRAREVEARVRPECRRKGVGQALLEHLSGADEELLCSFDAGHPRARRFVERRGFTLEGVVFFQRWDGQPADVPRAFPSCTLHDGEDAGTVLDLLQTAHGDAWPPPVAAAADLRRREVVLRVARVEGRPAGALVAWRDDDVWTIGGLAVLPAQRGRGVGRALCCDLMRRAAEEGRGVVLRVHHADEGQQSWTQGLGFWTYRSWACYRRPPRRRLSASSA
ncbi:MAG: GNAT family N-acetyltransferase [Myxococcales bacterium]|nr:GNAT family N-acetyltransferase [Myxococcales bacterium]